MAHDLNPTAEFIPPATNGREPRSGSELFTRVEILLVLLIGVIGSIVGGLQPLLLGGLAAEERLTLSEMGQTATAEALGMAIGVAVAGAVFKPRRLKLIVLAAAAGYVLANGVTMFASHDVVLFARLTAGLSGGIMLWVWLGLLTRLALPSRWVAIYLSTQAACVLLLSSIFSAVVIPASGASGGYAILMGAGVIVGLAAFGIPAAYPLRAGDQVERFQMPSRRGFVGLLAVVLNLAAVMAFWIFVLPIGEAKGLPLSFVSLAVSISLASQIAGGICGAVFARLDARYGLYGSLAGSILGLALVAFSAGPLPFVVGATIVVFFWMFAPTYQLPFLLVIDPGRGAAMQMITAQLLGLSVGPALISLLIGNGDVMSVLAISASLYAMSAFLVFVATTLGRSPASWKGGPASNA